MFWNEHPWPGQDECNELCVTGYEVGVPVNGIAYAHPECAKHSEAWMYDALMYQYDNEVEEE